MVGTNKSLVDEMDGMGDLDDHYCDRGMYGMGR